MDILGSQHNVASSRMDELVRTAQQTVEGVDKDSASDEVRRAGKKMESLFATMLVKEMRQALPEGFFGKGPGADIYEGWLDEHIGKSLTEGRGLGISELLERTIAGQVIGVDDAAGMPDFTATAPAAPDAKGDEQ